MRSIVKTSAQSPTAGSSDENAKLFSASFGGEIFSKEIFIVPLEKCNSENCSMHDFEIRSTSTCRDKGSIVTANDDDIIFSRHRLQLLDIYDRLLLWQGMTMTFVDENSIGLVAVTNDHVDISQSSFEHSKINEMEMTVAVGIPKFSDDDHIITVEFVRGQQLVKNSSGDDMSRHLVLNSAIWFLVKGIAFFKRLMDSILPGLVVLVLSVVNFCICIETWLGGDSDKHLSRKKVHDAQRGSYITSQVRFRFLPWFVLATYIQFAQARNIFDVELGDVRKYMEQRRLGEQKSKYFERTSGMCTDGGGSLIETKEECEKGAGIFGWAETTAGTVSHSSWPPGCLLNSYHKMNFNTEISSAKPCSSSYKCLCKLICPADTYQDQTGQTTCKACATGQFSPAGTSSCEYDVTKKSQCKSGGNSHDCSCIGTLTTYCNVFSGFFCYKEQNKCFTGPLCTNRDGITSNKQDCMCGTSGCTALTGFYCNIETNTCSPGPDCAFDDGLTENVVECKCGTNKFCNKINGMYCPDATYVKHIDRDKECTDLKNGHLVTDSVDCAQAAVQFGFMDDVGSMKLCSKYRQENHLNRNMWCTRQNDASSYPNSARWGGRISCLTYGFYSTCPPGCFTSVYNSQMGRSVHVNAGSTVNQCMHNRPCFCWTGLSCTYTEGIQPNHNDCMCGTTICSGGHNDKRDDGLYCTVSTNTCSGGPLCSFNDGSAVNQDDCMCGTSSCTKARGLFCYAEGNKCSPTIIPVCANTLGTISNTGSCLCGISECTSITSGLFCSENFNRCSHIPVCPASDGSVAATTICPCGATISCNLGEFCFSTAGRCSVTQSCANRDGTKVNTGACPCGSNNCVDQEYCYLPENKCQVSPDPLWVPTCSFENNSKPNLDTCVCGSNICSETDNGPMCSRSTSTCSCATGQSRSTGKCKLCAAGKYSDKISSSFCNYCSVGKFSNAIGATSVHSCINCHKGKYLDEIVENECKNCRPGTQSNDNGNSKLSDCKICPEGYFVDEPGSVECIACSAGKYNADAGVAAENHRRCTKCPHNVPTSQPGASFCSGCPIGWASLAIAPCQYTDGWTENDAECDCGMNKCTTDTGLYCYADADQCATAMISNICAIRNGLETSQPNCQCGTVTCTLNTGLICYSETGGGSCRKNAPSSHGFPLAATSNCNEVSGRGTITTKAKCEEVAKILELVGQETQITNISNSSLPPGCSRDPLGQVFFNDNDNATGTCDAHGADGYCICIADFEYIHTIVACEQCPSGKIFLFFFNLLSPYYFPE